MNSVLYSWCCTIALSTVAQGNPVQPTLEQPLQQLEVVVNLPNWKWKTMGGKQFWSDEAIYRDWRIQRNVLTGHCRLLDPANVRYAWGSYPHCQTELERVKLTRRLPPVDGKVVIVLHGIMRSRDSMAPLCKYLDDQGYSVLNVSYASSRAGLSHHAAALAKIISNLPEAKEIYLVGHSMGNLVVRHFWGDQSQPNRGRRPDPRIKRIVMLAPPNNSPQLARLFEDNPLFRLLWGASGKQMAEWNSVEKRLATPTVEFGIVAGDGNGRTNPLLTGETDLVVSVEETKLAGAHDFVVMPTIHSFIMRHKPTQEAIVRFIEKGYFLTEEKRRPLTAEPASTPR